MCIINVTVFFGGVFMNLNFDFSQFVEDFESSCQKVQIKHFSKNELITSYIAKRNQFCILLNGNADLVRYDLNGNRTIVEHFSKNDVFRRSILFYYNK